MAQALFTRTEYKISSLVDMIDSGALGVPKLQREYVWKASKIRDLLDSMLKGYPIGYLMLWKSQSSDKENRTIGIGEHVNKKQDYLIIDGQQRLTSLYAIMSGKKILAFDNEKDVKIAFNPLEKKFEVSSKKHTAKTGWISNIAEIYLNANNTRIYINKFIEEYRVGFEESGSQLTPQIEQEIDNSISEVLNLKEYLINALVIEDNVDEESVADIFTRVNSGGTKLNENDFILTLVSVNSPELREKINQFCKDSKTPSANGHTSYNRLIELEPSHIIRTTMAVAFKRAKLKYAYKQLKGLEMKRGEGQTESKEAMEKSFQEFEAGLSIVLDVENWQEFIRTVMSAGYINKNLISAKNNLVYCYMMFLIGKCQYKMDANRLRKIISRWYFTTALTSHYTNSFETTVQEELNELEDVMTADEFENYLDKKMNMILTTDYFNITLPEQLNTSASDSPQWNAYLASLNIINVKALFSDLYIRDLLSKNLDGKRNAVERHHLFPKKYLKDQGYKKDKIINQVANYSYIEWKDNMDILDVSPSKYFPDMVKAKIKEAEYDDIMKYHALPKDWINMSYDQFLVKRRKLMSQIIK